MHWKSLATYIFWLHCALVYILQSVEKVSSSNDSMFKAFAQLMSGLKDGESDKTKVTSQNPIGGFFSTL